MKELFIAYKEGRLSLKRLASEMNVSTCEALCQFFLFLEEESKKQEKIRQDFKNEGFSRPGEKLQFLLWASEQSRVERLRHPLPCGVVDCLNIAQVGLSHYDIDDDVWHIQPLCQSCAISTAKLYGVRVDDIWSDSNGKGTTGNNTH